MVLTKIVSAIQILVPSASLRRRRPWARLAKRARALLKAAEDAGMSEDELEAIIAKRAKKRAA